MSTGGQFRSLSYLLDCEYRVTYCSHLYQHTGQFLDRHLAILPPSHHAHEHVPIQGHPLSPSPVVRTIFVWRAVQPPP